MNLQQIDETLSKWANDFEREGTPVSKERLTYEIPSIGKITFTPLTKEGSDHAR